MSAEANAQLRRAQVNLEEANLAPIRSVRSRHRRCERAARHSGDGNVNPIITWVRLAQRIPVHIHIDKMPPGLLLSAGMATMVEMTVRDRGRGT
jgi:hypothetical protein